MTESANAPINALLELHTINKQRSRLMHAERKRSSGVRKAEKELAAATAAAEKAAEGTNQADALIRSLNEEIAGLQGKINALKDQQLNAENNKAYLATINEAEIARADLAAKQARLASIEGAAASQQAAAEAAAEAKTAAEAKLAAEREAATPDEEAAGALERLKQLYKEQQQKVDPELLARYVRLIKSGHRQPLLSVHPVTGATSFGNRLPTSQLERLRRGEIVVDQMTQSILHLEDLVEDDEE